MIFWRRRKEPITSAERSVRVVRYDQHGNPVRVEYREGVRAVKRHILDVINALTQLRRFFEQDLTQLIQGLEEVEKVHQPHLLQELRVLKEKTDHTYNRVLRELKDTHQHLDTMIIQSIKEVKEYITDVQPLLRQIEYRLTTLAAKQHQEERKARNLENHLHNLHHFILQHERELNRTPLIQALRELHEIVEKIKEFLRREGSTYYRETREMFIKEWDRLERAFHKAERSPTAENVKQLLDALRLFKGEVDSILENLTRKEALGLRLERELQLEERNIIKRIGEAQAFARGLQKSA